MVNPKDETGLTIDAFVVGALAMVAMVAMAVMVRRRLCEPCRDC
jgi:hypothetical protein